MVDVVLACVDTMYDYEQYFALADLHYWQVRRLCTAISDKTEKVATKLDMSMPFKVWCKSDA